MSVAGVVAALRVEALALGPLVRRGDGLMVLDDATLVAVNGMGARASAAAAQTLIDAGAAALVSWGLAGGLDPALRAGTLCLPRVVMSVDGARYDTDRRWRESLADAIATCGTIVCEPLLTSPSAIANSAAKLAAFRATGAVAVDMESTAIASVAEAQGLPFLAIRSIIDTAADTLPGAVTAATRSGSVSKTRLMLGILRRPSDLPPLMRLARRHRDATRALVAVARTRALGSLLPPTAFVPTV